MPPYESNRTALDMKRTPILILGPRSKSLESDVGKFTVKRGAIHRKTDAVEPFVHLDGILAYALADNIERDLVIGKVAAGDTGENGHGVIPRELVAREVETLAGEASGVLEDANGDRPDIWNGNLSQRPCRRERRRVDPFRQLLFHKIEVLHEGNGRENRCADADFGNVLFDLVLAVEVRNARLLVGGSDRCEDEMYPCGLGCVGGRNTLSYLGVCAPKGRRHREERGRSSERLAESLQRLRAMLQRAPPRRSRATSPVLSLGRA